MNWALRILVGVLLLGSVSLIVGANLARPATSFQFKWDVHREVPLGVRIDRVQIGTIVHSVSAPGDIEADVEVDISPKVMGRIVKLAVREGDKVQRGALLAQLDSADFEASVKMGEARVQRFKSSIESASFDVAKADRDVQRDRRLLERGSINRAAILDLETLVAKSKSALAMVRAELADAEAALAKAKEDLKQTTLRSPIDGVVSRLSAEEGETVVAGIQNSPGTVIMTVSDMRTMVVRARVDETDVPLVRPGQKVLIHVQYNEDAPLAGKVIRVSPKGIKGAKGSGGSSATAAVVANPNDVAVFETIIGIEHPPPTVQLGMTANVDIQVEQRVNVPTVATTAVLHRRLRDLPRRLAEPIERSGNKGSDTALRYFQVVYVDAQGHAECRLVKTSVSDETRVEVQEGLRDGERVVSGPYRIFDKLKDGKPIVEMTEEAGSAP